MKTTFAQAIRQAQNERDAQAFFEYLQQDNERRLSMGLPTFEPSLELAHKAINPYAELDPQTPDYLLSKIDYRELDPNTKA